MQNTPTTVNDSEVIRQVLEGNVNAFEALLQKYQRHVTMLVKKHVPYEHVEEIAHTAFIRIYQSLPNCKDHDHFRQWISAIAVRTCYDFWRKEYRNKELPISSLSQNQQHWIETVISDQSSQSFDQGTDRDDAKAVLDWALSKLSAEDRMVIELVYLEGLSGKEAAELLGWSVANVKVRSFRARKKLEKLLIKHDQSS